MRATGRERPGDSGVTNLPTEAGISKASLRIAVIGDLDELNASLGVAAALAPGDLRRIIQRLQGDLFAAGADISKARGSRMLSTMRVRLVERDIERLEQGLPALKRFILPGGSGLAAAFHVARAVCRRAERSAVALSERQPVNPAVLAYLNRLSSLLFAMARAANARAGVAETEWKRPAR